MKYTRTIIERSGGGFSISSSQADGARCPDQFLHYDYPPRLLATGAYIGPGLFC